MNRERAVRARDRVVVPFAPPGKASAAATAQEPYYPMTAIRKANLDHHAAQARAAWADYLDDPPAQVHRGSQAVQDWEEARRYYGELHGHTPDQIAYDLEADRENLDVLARELDLLCDWAGVDRAVEGPAAQDRGVDAGQLDLFELTAPADAADDDTAGW